MNRSAVFQVSHHENIKIIQFPLSFINRIKVKESLCGMLIRTVSCINNRNTCNFTGKSGTAFKWMTHNDKVTIIAYGFYCITQGFPFCSTGDASFCKTDYSATKAVYCTLKT